MCNRLQNFLIGKEFVIETDRKPLVSVLTTKFLYNLTPRLLHLLMKLQQFQYNIIHTPGKNLVVADLLSRQSVSGAHKNEEIMAEELSYATISIIETLPASTSTLHPMQETQAKDTVGQRLRSFIEKAWPASNSDTLENLIPYRHHHALYISRNLILFRNRLWILSVMRQQILEKLHASYFRITKICALVRTSV